MQWIISLESYFIDQSDVQKRLFVPVGVSQQHIMIYDKQEDGSIKEDKWLGVMVSSCESFGTCYCLLLICVPKYVPLTDEDDQRGGWSF